MSESQYVIWFIAMCIAIFLILGGGMLLVSGSIKLPGRHREHGPRQESMVEDDHTDEVPDNPHGFHHAA